jgi:hypothetical protein
VYIHGIDSIDYVKFHESHPDVIFTPHYDESLISEDSLVVWDDMMGALSGKMNGFFTDFITKIVHHKRISTLVILHNLYEKNMRSSLLSADYIALFNFIRDRNIATSMGKQILPNNNKFFREAYDFSTRRPFHFLFCDLHPLQNSVFRFRTGIFNDENTLLLAPS